MTREFAAEDSHLCPPQRKNCFAQNYADSLRPALSDVYSMRTKGLYFCVHAGENVKDLSGFRIPYGIGQDPVFSNTAIQSLPCAISVSSLFIALVPKYILQQTLFYFWGPLSKTQSPYFITCP